MTAQGAPRHALVFGASGLIGRHLVLALAESGAHVTAAVRSAASGARVERWLSEHGLSRSIETTIVDFDAPEIVAGGAAAFSSVTEIHSCAASFRFGMSADEARRANVGIVEKLLDLAEKLPELTRLVHISGYRVGGQDPAAVPWSDERRAAVYRELGGYEASKVESDALFQAGALERGIPWTIVNPAGVIGDSATGETDQYIGLAATVEKIWDGSTTALPAGRGTWVPVTTVDHLAGFMAAAAIDPDAAGTSYWILDDETPPLTELLSHVGRRYGAKVPRLRVPVSVIKRLPQSITKADPEALGFLSDDRYPTATAIELSARHELRMPDVRESLDRWSDYLVAHRFGRAGADDRRFVDRGGVRTFELGRADAHRLILPGLPVNADTWAEVAAAVDARAADLPGLGLSGGTGVQDWGRWLPAVLGEVPVELIGHSLGAAAVVLSAGRLPERVASLTLVAPFFLQPRAAVPSLLGPLVRSYLGHVDPARLSSRLTGSTASAAALDSTVSDLRRTRAARVAAQLARAGSTRWRTELREALERFDGPIRILTGSKDPLDPAVVARLASRPNVELISVAGAGHHPQLTHGQVLAEMLIGAGQAARR